jgi:predicted ABC-type ATPase
MADPRTPSVVIVGGPNGAGKSTCAPLLVRDTLGVKEWVNADAIAQGLSAFQPTGVALEAGRLMLERLHDLAARGADFAFETTLSGRTYARFLQALTAQGYATHLVFLSLRSADIAVERVRLRVERGGHSVPEADIRRRYILGIQNLLTLYTPLVDSWAVYDNSGTSEPTLTALGGAGYLNVFDESAWQKLRSVVHED